MWYGITALDAQFDMAHPNIGASQRILHGEPATDGNGDMIVLPKIGNVGGTLGLLTAAIDPIFGQIRSDVDVNSERRQTPVAPLANRQNGAGLGIGMAESDKVDGLPRGKDREIGLNIARRMAGCNSAEVTPPRGEPQFVRGGMRAYHDRMMPPSMRTIVPVM